MKYFSLNSSSSLYFCGDYWLFHLLNLFFCQSCSFSFFFFFLPLLLSFPLQPLLETSPSSSPGSIRQPDPQPSTVACPGAAVFEYMSEEEVKKKDGAADYMPASREEAHLTQPIWSRDKASFQTWLRCVDKRRGSRDYTWHRLCDRGKTLFQFSVL